MIISSLFFRMRLVHWVGIVLLLVSATFFTDNPIGMGIQYLVAAVVLLHDLDEKRWGVDSLKHMAGYLGYFSNKDLSVPSNVDARYNAEVRHVLGVVDDFRDAIRGTLADIKEVSRSNEQSAGVVQTTSARIGERLQEDTNLLESTRDAAGRVSSQADELASVATEARESIDQALSSLSQTRSDFEQIHGASRQTVASSDNLVRKLEQLSTAADQVQGVFTTIGSIAEQTNLLALNAAIEAARAGEAGRGFAVVADEVRSLAQRTQSSLTEVEEIVQNITGATAEVKNEADQQAEVLHGLDDRANGAQAAVRETSERINGLHGLINRSAEAASQIDGDINGVFRHIDELAGHSRHSTHDVEELLEQADRTSSLAHKLNGRLQEFTT